MQEKNGLQRVSEFFDNVQDMLSYDIPVDFIQKNQQYNNNHGLGRAGLNGVIVGTVFGFHLAILLVLLVVGSNTSFSTAIFVWSQYFIVLSLFHFLEFFVTSTSQPSKLNSDTFVINHSKSYTMAAVASWIEYWLEYLLFGGYKTSFSKIRLMGICLILFGQVVRSNAMWHCGENFSHLIVHKKEQSHLLVTDGIYTYFRHPSYLGFFYWSIGTQVMLCNPICIIAYAAASFMFFKERIAYEEKLLFSFFKQDYIDYMKRSYIGIPFIPITKLEQKSCD